MPNSILVTLTMLLIMAVPVGLLAALGVVVYKDAKAHNMSAGLWAVVAVLAPNFIGVIIYLIVRSNQEKKLNCSNCNAEVKADYNVCPNCQSVFENICDVCKHAVNTQMSYCPYCGTHIEEDVSHQTAIKVTKKTNIVKPLAIIGGIYVGIIVLIFGVMMTMAVASGDLKGAFKPSVSVMSVETSMGNRLKAKFHYSKGKDSISVKKVSGEALQIDGSINVEKGQITMIVEDPQGEVVYTQTYLEPDQEINEMIPVETEGKYKVRLEIDEAKGSYDLRAH